MFNKSSQKRCVPHCASLIICYWIRKCGCLAVCLAAWLPDCQSRPGCLRSEGRGAEVSEQGALHSTEVPIKYQVRRMPLVGREAYPEVSYSFLEMHKTEKPEENTKVLFPRSVFSSHLAHANAKKPTLREAF
jgi:hypothetical protein